MNKQLLILIGLNFISHFSKNWCTFYDSNPSPVLNTKQQQHDEIHIFSEFGIIFKLFLLIVLIHNSLVCRLKVGCLLNSRAVQYYRMLISECQVRSNTLINPL